ncbi:hypothetical protein MFIFM68171_05871 [Madurella fahalii]|uniref:C2H2-type domain-containing protein n=1 Tax=Madurella fahalii TaxID=1157608 RepID=A0ABQ0GD11_9PEZI
MNRERDSPESLLRRIKVLETGFNSWVTDFTVPRPQPARNAYSSLHNNGSQLQQHQRPRKKIESIYKCGWNGCEQAYSTPRHLNFHIVLGAHRRKRTADEFKKVREELEARLKAEEWEGKHTATVTAGGRGGGDAQAAGNAAQL